jgi:hypothetical protein
MKEIILGGALALWVAGVAVAAMGSYGPVIEVISPLAPMVQK